MFPSAPRQLYSCKVLVVFCEVYNCKVRRTLGCARPNWLFKREAGLIIPVVCERRDRSEVNEIGKELGTVS